MHLKLSVAVALVSLVMMAESAFKPPNEWRCQGKKIQNADKAAKGAAKCVSESGVCQTLCVAKESIIDHNFKLTEDRAKAYLMSLLQSKTTVHRLLKEFKKCLHKVDPHDKSKHCDGNAGYTKCLMNSAEDICEFNFSA